MAILSFLALNPAPAFPDTLQQPSFLPAEGQTSEALTNVEEVIAALAKQLPSAIVQRLMLEHNSLLREQLRELLQRAAKKSELGVHRVFPETITGWLKTQDDAAALEGISVVVDGVGTLTLRCLRSTDPGREEYYVRPVIIM